MTGLSPQPGVHRVHTLTLEADQAHYEEQSQALTHNMCASAGPTGANHLVGSEKPWRDAATPNSICTYGRVKRGKLSRT